MTRHLALAAMLVALPFAAAAQDAPASPCERGNDDAKTWIADCQADIAATAPSDTARRAADYANLTFADINLALQTDHRFAAAIADATKGIAIDSGNIEAYLNRANAYFYAGDYGKSLADIAQLLRLDPNDAKGHSLRCNIDLKQDRPRDAIDDCRTAIVLGFDTGWSHLSLADALLATGDKASAIVQYQLAIDSKDLYSDEKARAVAALAALGAPAP